MGFVKRLVAWALLLIVALVGLQIAASESGEVVVLRTFADGDVQETRLWVVDDRGSVWLRAGQPTSAWYQRILANPDIEVERGGEVREYRAFPLEGGGPATDHINALMLNKYGWADQVIGYLFDRSDAVAIRLDPR